MIKVYQEADKVIIDEMKDFNLDHIFDCGQCFRWKKERDGSYTGIAYGKVINVNYIDQKKVIIDNTNLEDYNRIWKSYLDLDRDYFEIKKVLSENDEIMARAILFGQGIRILKQEKWETLISFLISQNNNIPRIKKCIENLCKSYGNLVGIYQGEKYYSFPEPGVIANLKENDLGALRLGYRGKYILETARIVAADGGASLMNMEEAVLEEARQYLMNLCGVGPKVANCILLFSMGKYESFPIDVWVKRVMNQLYLIDEDDSKAMQGFAQKRFGKYGGIAQQYLFYYIRGNIKILEE